MTQAIHKRIDDLTIAITSMGDNQTLERRETNRIMEKLADGQSELSKQLFARSTVDSTIEKRLENNELLLKQHDLTLTNILIDLNANTESRKESLKLKQKVQGTVLALMIMGSLYAWTIAKN